MTGLLFGAVCATALGQGAIRFSNLGSGAGGTTVNARMFGACGNRLSGPGYSVQLWYGPAATPENGLTALPSPILGFGTGAFAGYTSSAPTVQIPGVAVGGVATLQWRIWDNMGGTITNWTQALAAGAVIGKSAAFQSAALGHFLDPSSIPVMQGLTSFGFFLEKRISRVSLSGGNIMLNWTCGGTLEFTTNLLNTGTVWTSTDDGDGTYTAPVETGNRYFRVRYQ